MNILLLTNELRYACGVTNHLLHLSSGLLESKKIKLLIICGGGNGLDRFKDIDLKISVDKRFLHKGRNIKNFISAIAHLVKFIKKNNIEIVHSHTHYAANIARNASKLIKIKTIQTNHGLLQTKGILKHFSAEKYIAVNEHIYNYVLENRITGKNNVRFIRCGIPVPEKYPQKVRKKLKIIAASRFDSEKGLDTYINAVAGVKHILKTKAEFYIAGAGKLEKDLKKMSSQKRTGIHFLGIVKDMYKLLSETHIFVYPSRSNSEGFPAVITEAGATGNLVISSDFKGSEYVIKNNEDGLIFKQNDFAQLKKILTKVMGNYDYYIPISRSFHRKTKKMFDLGTMVKKHIELYKECQEK
jgi:glycosyltransferase involved in cell wall biosynthesis